MNYALITAARNEEQLIEKTIHAVTSQCLLPIRWAICSDGSTDKTDAIITSYASAFPWISYLRQPRDHISNFASKVDCLKLAYHHLQDLTFDAIGNLDADITFDNNYMQFLLDKLAADPSLGVVGTQFVENGHLRYNYDLMNKMHVSGGCQLFRRSCFDAMGGFTPMRRGGEDWAAVTTARMMGWRTQCYNEQFFFHHRPLGTAHRSAAAAMFRQGERDYLTGNHPIWQIFRSLFQMSRRPYLLGGGLLLCGYTYSLLKRSERTVSPNLVAFHRAEQMERLRRFLRGLSPNIPS